jgi:hypothetical protein
VSLRTTEFDRCLLREVEFRDVVFESVRFIDVLGLPTCKGLDRVFVRDSGQRDLDFDLLSTLLDGFNQYASWERLRTFGRLPLFATSLSALVSIPIIFYLLSVYNLQIEHLKERPLPPDAPGQVRHFIDSLQPLALPSLSLWLLASTLLLGIASMIFSSLCPARVREFSLTQWMDEHGKPALHYLADSWSKRWARMIAAPFYLIGGGGTAIILLVKLWNAGEFIWKNSKFGWLS